LRVLPQLFYQWDVLKVLAYFHFIRERQTSGRGRVMPTPGSSKSKPILLQIQAFSRVCLTLRGGLLAELLYNICEKAKAKQLLCFERDHYIREA
jgi:hypothetical protein